MRVTDMCATVKKGKFKLKSYSVDKELIFFPSLNKVKKVVAFSIIKVSDLVNTLSVLKELIEKGSLSYFTFQISISRTIEEYFILCLVDFDINTILDTVNSLKKILANKNLLPFSFLEKKQLENQFFKIGFTFLDSKVHKLKSTDSIIIENERDFSLLDIYNLDLSELENKDNFIYNFTNLIKKFNIEGYLVFNFKSESEDLIVTSGYFIELKHDIQDEFNLEYEINRFFDYDIVEPFSLEINDVYKVLWRLDISDHYLLFKDMEEILISRYKKKEIDINQVNIEFEKSLEENGVVFHRLNPKSILIESKLMFMIFKEIDFQLISRIFDKIYPKYSIYILIIDDSQYAEMIKVKKLTELPNVRILDYNTFLQFDVREFKS
ncbi:MAG: hypothetical protein KJI71_00450 [Patescibacteria group bacterium]|nr:hypothetical protein [Patescibacteria group bacterium]